MSQYFIFSILTVLAFNFVACSSDSNSSSSGNKNGAGAQGAGSFLASYEASDSCSTGRHVFTGSTEEEIGTAFCNAINDEKLNGHCAIPQRERVFEAVQCPGKFQAENVSLSSSVLTQSYAFSENSCGTGLHYFTASKQEALQRMVCRALADDELNRNCAKSKREEKFREQECDPSFRNLKPDPKPEMKPDSKPEPEFKVGGEGSEFSCYEDHTV